MFVNLPTQDLQKNYRGSCLDYLNGSEPTHWANTFFSTSGRLWTTLIFLTNVATIGVLTRLESSKIVLRRGSARDPAGGCDNAPPDPLSGEEGDTPFPLHPSASSASWVRPSPCPHPLKLFLAPCLLDSGAGAVQCPSLSVRVCLCLSVSVRVCLCLSQVGVLSKRLKNNSRYCLFIVLFYYLFLWINYKIIANKK